jgi:hypothetical protein
MVRNVIEHRGVDEKVDWRDWRAGNLNAGIDLFLGRPDKM